MIACVACACLVGRLLAQCFQLNRALIATAPGRYGLRMAKLGVSREVLARMLREHGEDDLAGRALTLPDNELARIGTLGAYYAFSEDAMALGGSMGGARALSLAAIDVLEGTGRDLRLSRAEREREGSCSIGLQKTTS